MVQGLVDELEEMNTPAARYAICRLFGNPIAWCNRPSPQSGDGVYRLNLICVFGLSGQRTLANLNINGSRRTTTTDEEQSACVETGSFVTNEHVVFCKRNGEWIPKRSISRHPQTDAPEHTLEVRADGTFIGIQHVDRDNVGVGSRKRLLLRVVARANPTTDENEGAFHRVDYTFSQNAGGVEDTRIGYGAGARNPLLAGGDYSVDLSFFTELPTDAEPPRYCFEGGDAIVER
jgi:hypothetical protein